jgi:hypothetical protein
MDTPPSHSQSGYPIVQGTPNCQSKSTRTGRITKKSKQQSTTVLACNHCRSKKIKVPHRYQFLTDEADFNTVHNRRRWLQEVQETWDAMCLAERRPTQMVRAPVMQKKILTQFPSSPSSKTHIRELYQRIASLEAALEAATTPQPPVESPPHQFQTPDETHTPSLRSSSLPSIHSDDGDNIISRLCGRQWKLNSDEEGQYKFFGPTSSLHLTESVSSSLLGPSYPRAVGEDASFDDKLDLDTKAHLLDFYWKYQHTVLQVFDREEFLEGLTAQHSKYFSKALLYTVYACAARISDRPAIRAMVIPSQDALDDDQPFLVATATQLVEEELKRPQITTIQALLLLSVIHCSLSRDTIGWLLTGKSSGSASQSLLTLRFRRCVSSSNRSWTPQSWRTALFGPFIAKGHQSATTHLLGLLGF